MRGREALKERDRELEEARQRLELQEAELREQGQRVRQAEDCAAREVRPRAAFSAQRGCRPSRSASAKLPEAANEVMWKAGPRAFSLRLGRSSLKMSSSLPVSRHPGPVGVWAQVRPAHSCFGCFTLTLGVEATCLVTLLLQRLGKPYGGGLESRILTISLCSSTEPLSLMSLKISPSIQVLCASWALAAWQARSSKGHWPIGSHIPFVAP